MFKLQTILLALTFGLFSAQEVDVIHARELQATYTKCLGCVFNDFIWSNNACSATTTATIKS